MNQAYRVTSTPHPGMTFAGFVTLVASLMAMNALSIDAMLPALPNIGAALDVQQENHRQWVLTAYMLGFGFAQIFYGPLGDRFGRKPVLLVATALYTGFSVLCAFSTSFEMMLAARFGQGLAAAASRVLAISVVRDCYSGRQMAKVMSLVFIVFLACPIFAPSLGQLILLVAPWNWIFLGLAALGLTLALMTALRLPETLRPEDRLPLSAKRITGAFRIVATNRIAVGYTLAMALMMGGLFGFINSIQQIYADVFNAAAWFAPMFAVMGIGMGFASFLNSRIVERLGTRLVSHTALVAYIAVAAVHVAIAASGRETMPIFALLQAVQMSCFGLVGSNFGSMAMEPMGHVAGTASAAQGFVTTLAGALVGFFIGQSFDGTVLPMAVGIFVTGCAALGMVAFAERGRLFQPHSPATAP